MDQASSMICARAPHLPTAFLAWHLWLEPIMTVGGAWLLYTSPELYMKFMPPWTRCAPSPRIVHVQLASTYLFLAITEILVLRATCDLLVWKSLIFGLLVCDVGHFVALLAGFSVSSPWLFRWEGITTMSISVLALVMRLSFFLGIGFNVDPSKCK